MVQHLNLLEVCSAWGKFIYAFAENIKKFIKGIRDDGNEKSWLSDVFWVDVHKLVYDMGF